MIRLLSFFFNYTNCFPVLCEVTPCLPITNNAVYRKSNAIVVLLQEVKDFWHISHLLYSQPDPRRSRYEPSPAKGCRQSHDLPPPLASPLGWGCSEFVHFDSNSIDEKSIHKNFPGHVEHFTLIRLTKYNNCHNSSLIHLPGQRHVLWGVQGWRIFSPADRSRQGFSDR